MALGTYVVHGTHMAYGTYVVPVPHVCGTHSSYHKCGVWLTCGVFQTYGSCSTCGSCVYLLRFRFKIWCKPEIQWPTDQRDTVLVTEDHKMQVVIVSIEKELTVAIP